MNSVKNDTNNWQSQQNKHTRNLAVWTFTWLLSTALLAFGAKYLWDFNATLSICALVLNLVLGMAMIKANIKHFQSLDELQRSIMQNAMSITLGVGLIAGIAYEQLEDIKLISYQPEINHLIVLMAITYMAATLIGHRQYK